MKWILIYTVIGCLFVLPAIWGASRRMNQDAAVSVAFTAATILLWPLILLIYIDTIVWKIRKYLRVKRWKNYQICSHLWLYETNSHNSKAECLYCGKVQILESES